MLNSFFTALSGLNANAQSLSVIGNNLANMNTVAYKTNIASFQDLVARTVLGFNGAGNPQQVGLGVQLAGTATNFSQGVLQTTSQPTDVAIVGPGFFLLQDGSQRLFSRAGNFTLDAEGNLLTQQGYNVQGWPAVQGGVVDHSAPLQDIRVDPGTVLPSDATTLMRFVTNLNSEMAVGDSFSTTSQLVDSLGGAHTVSVTFTRNATAPGAPPSFGFDITVPGDDVVGGTASTPFSLLTGADAAVPPPGTLDFDGLGSLTSVNPGTGALVPADDFTFTTPAFLNGAGAQTVTMDMVDDDGLGYYTSYVGPSTTSSTYQDGNPAASLMTFSVDQDGNVQGVFSNGKTAPMGQIAMASFNNPQGLVRIGGNAFRASFNSGEPSIGEANTGGRGSMSGGTLELSNVDIATEFTSLIIAQRGYQANSRVVTTTDEVFQEAINLKR